LQKVSINKRRIIIILVSLAVVAIAGILVHVWFINNARNVLKQVVYSRSNGKIQLELSELRFNFFTSELGIKEATLLSTDSLSQPNTYKIKFEKLSIQVRSFLPLLFKKDLSIDSIKIDNPDIEITQWRIDTSANQLKRDLSIPQEMGKLYNSMLDALESFGIRRIEINNARLSLLDKIPPASEPVVISNIYFSLIRTASGKKRDEFVENEHTVDLRTTNQSIDLPGGRHRISFKNFQLELFKQRIQLDSCTLSAIATDSSKSSYNIYFDKLFLVGVDFGAMYRSNLIKADSVYCESPLFNINLHQADASTRSERPDPEKIIRELAGNLDLAYVGVKKAGIHLNISGSKERTLFNSNQDDFEMRGFRINTDSTSPVTVQQFDMLVKDYRLFNEDSSTAYSFDSVRFINDKIILNNFSVVTSPEINKQRNYRDFSIPYFQLTGLNWYDLIFEENLYAREAVLYNPVINYVQKQKSVKRKNSSLFSVLHTLDDLVTLDKITVINGQVNMQLLSSFAINLKNVNTGIYSNRLLQSTNREGLRRAIDHLSFSSGRLIIKDVNAQLENVRYTADNLIQADKVLIKSKSNLINADIRAVTINNLLLDESSETFLLDGFKWHKASISLLIPDKNKRQKGNGSVLNARNISGNQTNFSLSKGDVRFKTFIDNIFAANITKQGGGSVEIDGLAVNGKSLLFTGGGSSIQAGSYSIIDNAPSTISQFKLERRLPSDTLIAGTSQLNFLADLNKLIQNKTSISYVNATSPSLYVYKNDQPSNDPEKSKTSIQIQKFTASNPDIKIINVKDDTATTILIPHSNNGQLEATGIAVSGDQINLTSIQLTTNSATFINRAGEKLGVEQGALSLGLSDIAIDRNLDKPSWAAIITNLDIQNPYSYSFGGNPKKAFSLQQASLGNFKLSSAYFSNTEHLIKNNVSAWLRTATGHYIDSNTTIRWYNAAYSSSTKTIQLDSFEYHPTQPLDSVIENSLFQTDYKTFKAGEIVLEGFDLDKYEKDSALIVNNIVINNPLITLYRDKKPPFLHGIIKPLPVEMVQRITMPVSVNAVHIKDGYLSYTERHASSRAEGTIFFTGLEGVIGNLKNRNTGGNDSLLLSLNGYLLDSALVNLRVKQSYADTLGSFLMTLRVQPTSLTFLNPVVAPLSNVIITSGQIDSLHLRAIGQEYLSLGEMKMYYKNLKIKLVKDGDPESTTFLRNVASFLANTFIIKKNNKGRTGLVYFERLRDRSFFNYIVKMTLSGMGTSIGIKSNRKVKKQYERELRQQELPPINFE
jgi:hypothetical protein